jgi:predicted transcriptional regulator
MSLAEMLFELSSEDRLKILSEIGRNRRRASQLVPHICATIQEASRQVARLHDAGLIERDSGGKYGLTSFGVVILKLIPSLDFVSRNRAYFLEHDISTIPQEFLERVGELSESELGETAGLVLRHAETILSEAKEYIWLLSDHTIYSGQMITQAVMNKEVRVRILVPGIDPDDRSGFDVAKDNLRDRLEIRFAPDIRVAIAMSEDRVGVAFPNLAGKIDYNAGLRGTGDGFRRWCGDIFSFYWQRSRTEL